VKEIRLHDPDRTPAAWPANLSSTEVAVSFTRASADVRCDVFDHRGKSAPPLLKVMNPRYAFVTIRVFRAVRAVLHRLLPNDIRI
jgi:hypothetical protein